MKLCYIDVETGGLYANKNPLLQLSGIIEIDGEEKERFNFFLRPFTGQEVDPRALKVNKLTIEQIETFEDPKLVFGQFIKLLSKYVSKFNRQDKFFFIGYNSQSFDEPFVRQFFKNAEDKYGPGSWFWYPSIDMMLVWGHILSPKRHTMKNFKLVTVCQTAGITVDESKLHDAMYDIELTRDLYKAIK